MAWYVLYTKLHKEVAVIKQLGHKNIEVYFPQIKVPGHKGRLDKFVPFFPRYIFINTDCDMVIDPKVKWMPGLVCVVSFDDKPAVVSDEIIQQLKKRIRGKEIKWNFRNGEYSEGDYVTIVEGPFAGYSGIFNLNLSGGERARILIKLINNQSKKIVVPYEQLRKEENIE